MSSQPFYLVDIVADVVSAMKVQNPLLSLGTFLPINFEPGRSIQILQALAEKDSSTTLKDLKYPLVAMVMPVPETLGSGFIKVKIPRIVFAYLTKTGTDSENVLDKYDSDGVFKKYLYPCYYEFLRRLAWSIHTNMGDPEAYVHTKIDNPSQQPIGEGLNDYVDILEIQNLEIIFNYTKIC